MANKVHMQLLFQQGVDAWNQWRQAHPKARPNIRFLDLSGANLSNADFRYTNLSRANLSRANLSRANLSRANLSWALQLHFLGAR